MKTLAFVFGLCILAVGVVGVITSAGLVWIAEHSVNRGAFYFIAAVRIAFGLTLISVSSASRAPKTLRVLGYIILILGITTALTGMVAIGPARASIELWSQQGSSIRRFTAIFIVGLGGFVAYACAPARRADLNIG